MNIQLRKLYLLIQHFMILQLRHTSFITQSLKEIHSGRETGLIDTSPFNSMPNIGLVNYIRVLMKQLNFLEILCLFSKIFPLEVNIRVIDECEYTGMRHFVLTSVG